MPELRAVLYTAATATMVNSARPLSNDGKSGSMLISPVQRFAIANCLAILPQLSVIGVLSQGPWEFILLVLLWNVAPILMSIVFFLAGARPAGWGWLFAAGMWGLWNAIAVQISESSTASLAFMWAPIWSFTVLGPLGAGIAILYARRKRAEKGRSE